MSGVYPTPHAIRVRSRIAKEKQAARFFQVLCVQRGLPEPVLELRFAPPRQWRFDFSWPDAKLALESEGGIWNNGAHTRGKHFLSDVAKYNQAALLGWRVLRTVPAQLCTDDTISMLRQALGGSPP